MGGTTRWCAIALGLLAVGCGGGDGGGEDGPTTTADTSTTTTALPTEPTYEVGQEGLTLVDPSRPTPAVLDFLDATLRDDDQAFDDLAALISSSGIAELRVRTSPAG